jgi:hypothetical protein
VNSLKGMSAPDYRYSCRVSDIKLGGHSVGDT